MLFFPKSQPAPACLAQEQTKASGDYKCGDVLPRIQADFRGKCYICETRPTVINVEHFQPHRGAQALKFDWHNLYWACGHCNHTKSDQYTDMLDCTNPDDDVETKLKYVFKPFPHERIAIEAIVDDPKTASTRELVLAVFNGTTELKQLEAATLRAQLLQEIRDFQGQLCEYFEPTCDPERQAYLRPKIKAHLHEASLFTSFKRWIIRDNARLKQEFQEYI